MKDFNNMRNQTQLANRNDYCYLCAKDIVAKDEDDYYKQFKALRGKLEGQTVVKIKQNGNETIICLDCIHKLAKDNPLTKKEVEDK